MNHNNKNFYSINVHKSFYDNLDDTKLKYKKRILEEFKKLKFDYKKNLNKHILDFGTGIQSIVFHDLGFKKITHLDIDQGHLDFVKNYCNTNKIKNILSRKANLNNKIFPAKDYDIVFVYGIINHLKNNQIFFKNLLNNANSKCVILLRAYKNDNFSRWFVSKLRELTPLISLNDFDKYIKINNYNNNQYFSDLKDDLFVNIYKTFNIEKFKKSLEMQSVTYYSPDNYLNNKISLDENFRIKLILNEKIKSFNITIKESKGFVPEISDYSKFNYLWRKFKTKYKFLHKYEKIIIIENLYQLCRYKNHYDKFLQQNLKSDKKLSKNINFYKFNQLNNILKNLI